jgi:hypothetical protein
LYLTNLCTTLSTNVVSSEVVVFGAQQLEGGVNAGRITLVCPDLSEDLWLGHGDAGPAGEMVFAKIAGYALGPFPHVDLSVKAVLNRSYPTHLQ